MQNYTYDDKRNRPTSRPASVNSQSGVKTSATAPPHSRRKSIDGSRRCSVTAMGAETTSTGSIEALQQQLTALKKQNVALQDNNMRLQLQNTTLRRQNAGLQEQSTRLTQQLAASARHLTVQRISVSTGCPDGTYEIDTVNPQENSIICAGGLKFCFLDFDDSDRQYIRRVLSSVLSGTYGVKYFKGDYDRVEVRGGKACLVENEDYYGVKYFKGDYV